MWPATTPGTSGDVRRWERMLTDDQLELLREVQAAVAFDDGREGMADQLVISGHLKKVGDLYELTPDGEMALLANGVTNLPDGSENA
jgi:hypothetical protein